ncbi:MAG: GNAT family N-acetyltransferase [Methanobacteriota archaeon]
MGENPSDGKLVGVARYMGDGRGFEFAIVLVDKWQNKGLGRIMLRRLVDAARSNGIKSLFGLVYKNNNQMIRLIEKTGISYTVDSFDEETLKFDLNLG